MNLDALYSKLLVKTGAKLVLVVLDGLGDWPLSSRTKSLH
jgi:hypothetical protein